MSDFFEILRTITALAMLLLIIFASYVGGSVVLSTLA